MADDWNETGGRPDSVALHARFDTGLDPDGETRQVACDTDGNLLVGIVSPDPLPVEIVAPDPLPVTTEDRVVQTNEVLYSGWTSYDIQTMATGSPTTGVALNTHLATGGVLIVASPANTGTVYIGHSAATCFIPLPQGTPFSLAVGNTNLIYFRAASDGDGVYVAVYNL